MGEQTVDNLYVPILKAKQGELKAVSQLYPAARARIQPLFELPPIPTDYDDGSQTKTVDAYLSKHADNLSKNWPMHQSAFVDLGLLEPNDRTANNNHPVQYYFDLLRSAQSRVIPCTALDRDTDYQDAVAYVIKTDKHGVCVRISTEDAYDESFASNVDVLLKQLTVKPTEVDLIIDLEEISGTALQASFTARSILAMLPHIKLWRSITVAGTAFPENLSDFAANSVDATPRLEWDMWNRLRQTPGIARIPRFGDYTIAHNELPDVDPRIMKPSASIRYTTTQTWIIFRGRNLRSAKYGGYAQFRTLSANVVNHSAYCGSTFSWGDSYIDQCANQQAKTGNLTTWRAVATNHHLTFVGDQISRLGAPSGNVAHKA